jgi:hypothetical protein
MRCRKAVPLTQSQDVTSKKRRKERQIEHLQHIHGRTNTMQALTAAVEDNGRALSIAAKPQ